MPSKSNPAALAHEPNTDKVENRQIAGGKLIAGVEILGMNQIYNRAVGGSLVDRELSLVGLYLIMDTEIYRVHIVPTTCQTSPVLTPRCVMR